MKFSVLMPTRQRAVRAEKAVNSIFDTAVGNVEVFLYLDDDDPELKAYQALGFNLTIGPSQSVGKSWNALAKKCTGDVLIMGNDDVVYETKGWDQILEKEVLKYPDGIFVMWFNDMLRSKCTFPMVSRTWYETLDYFTPEIFGFLYNDTWVWDIGKRVERLHPIMEVVTNHHHLFSKTGVINDATYQRGRRLKSGDSPLFAQTFRQREEAADKLREVMR